MAEQPVVVSMTFVDEWGTEASAPFYAQADDTKTIAALVTEAQALVSAVDATSDAYLRRMRLELFPALPGGVKTAAATGARIEQTGLLGFTATGTSKRYSATIPAISNGATVLSGDRIVLTGVDPVGVLIAILTTVGTVLKWCNAHNQQIVDFIDALIAFHKKRKQLQRSSYEV
jgi:cell shape-determining protein MreC